jgi:hypothetical protein
VQVYRARRHPVRGQPVHVAALDSGRRQVLLLGRVEVACVDQHDPLLGHRPDPESVGDEFGAVAGEDTQRHAAEVARRGGFQRLQVAVGVEPDDRGVEAGALHARDDGQRRRAVTGQHHWAVPVPNVVGDGGGHERVQMSHPLPRITVGQFGGDDRRRAQRHVEVGKLLVEVIRHEEVGHPCQASVASAPLPAIRPPDRRFTI